MTHSLDLLPRVRTTLDRYHLLPRDATVLVAVSGGADSLSLLHLLGRLAPEFGWRLTVAVFDHGQRPESAAEAAATAAWAEQQGWPVRLGRADAPCHDEAGARDQRHAFLRRCADEVGAEHITLGHSADDRAETLLLNLLRGAGTRGLGAMPARSGRLARPLLDCARAELAAYAAAHALPVVNDPTNQDGNLRARVRAQVLPLLETLRPGARQAVARAAGVCDLDRQALDNYGQLLLDGRRIVPEPASFIAGLGAAVLDVSGWSAMAQPERHLLLRAWLGSWRGTLAEVDAVLVESLDTLAGGRADARPLTWPRVLGAATATRCGSRLAVAHWPAPTPWGPVELGAALPAGVPRLGCGPGELCACLRAGRYTVRSRRPGDHYQPAGRPRKPLGDWLAEQGVPAPARDRVPLVVLGDQIVWLPGQQPAEGFADPDGPLLGVVF